MEAIRCNSLTKNFRVPLKEPGVTGALRSFFDRKFKEVHAVQNFSVDIQAGELVGLLGPNGAGKTTLMKMLTGIIAPSFGSATVLGYQPFERALDFRRRISLVMGQKSQLWWDIPAYDSFLLLKSYYQVSNSDFSSRIEELSALLNVEKLLNIHVRRLSLGERMKMELMACLLHNPEIIFLDEPTIGLDVVAQNAVRNFLLEYHSRYSPTIILTSHYMADVEALCSRIVLILEGRKRFDGSLERFGSSLGSTKRVSLFFRDAQDPNHSFWSKHKATWNNTFTEVELDLEQSVFRETLSEAFSAFPIENLVTEKIPIERVMKTLLQNPELLSSTEATG